MSAGLCRLHLWLMLDSAGNLQHLGLQHVPLQMLRSDPLCCRGVLWMASVVFERLPVSYPFCNLSLPMCFCQMSIAVSMIISHTTHQQQSDVMHKTLHSKAAGSCIFCLCSCMLSLGALAATLPWPGPYASPAAVHGSLGPLGLHSGPYDSELPS